MSDYHNFWNDKRWKLYNNLQASLFFLQADFFFFFFSKWFQSNISEMVNIIYRFLSKRSTFCEVYKHADFFFQNDISEMVIIIYRFSSKKIKILCSSYAEFFSKWFQNNISGMDNITYRFSPKRSKCCGVQIIWICSYFASLS